MNPTHQHITQELLFQLDQKQKQIGEYLLSCDLDYTDRVGIMDGLAGMALTLSLYYRCTGDERFFDKMNQTIDLIHEKLYTGKVTSFSYCSGLSGYAWLILFMKENDIIEVDLDDYLLDIDQMLLRSVMLMIEEGKFDTLHYAVGIGFYFLKRGNFEILEKIIVALYNDRKKIGGYLTWSMINFTSKTEVVDLGLAHGLPGILLFLYRCYLKQVLPQKCSEMLRDNISLMFNLINISGKPSFFPSSIECDKFLQYDSKQNFSRLAWCYGDLTALYVLLQMSPDFTAQMDIIQQLEQVAQRRSDAETLVNDAGFCHGASGIAHIFSRLYQQTGYICFDDAAKYWMTRTLMFGNHIEGLAGYAFPDKNIRPLDLLVGITGVGAVLLSFQNPELMNWDESMLLM